MESTVKTADPKAGLSRLRVGQIADFFVPREMLPCGVGVARYRPETVRMELDPKERLAWQRLSTYRSLAEFRRLKALLAPEVPGVFRQ